MSPRLFYTLVDEERTGWKEGEEYKGLKRIMRALLPTSSSATWLLHTASSFIKSWIVSSCASSRWGRLKTRYVARKCVWTAGHRFLSATIITGNVDSRVRHFNDTPWINLSLSLSLSSRTPVNFNLMDFTDSRLFFFCRYREIYNLVYTFDAWPFHCTSALALLLLYVYVLHIERLKDI